MAAKPPKPPGNFLKELNDCLNNTNKNTSSDNSNNKNAKHNKTNVADLKKLGKDVNSNGNILTVSVNEISLDNRINGNNNATTISKQTPSSSSIPTPKAIHPITTAVPTLPSSSTPISTSKSNCNCTNISIMHLFHEMKQEFPTIPDTIVAQCVNENCHKRENCMQKLRNELAVNPIPVQSYPAKVLHPPQRPQSVPKTATATKLNSNTSFLSPPLKPIRPAPIPTTTPIIQPSSCISAEISNSLNQKLLEQRFSQNLCEKKVNCDNNSLVLTTNINTKTSKIHQCSNNNNSTEKDVDNNIGGVCKKTERTQQTTTESAAIATTITSNISKNSDMPTITKSLTYDSDCDGSCVSESQSALLNDNRRDNIVSSSEVPLTANAVPLLPLSGFGPRMRPTTLNLQTEFQQQQRQHINKQLQKHFQQRNQQHQQQLLLHQTKPLRKAPLPPLPPKPVQFANVGAHSPQFYHNVNINNINNTNTNSDNHSSKAKQNNVNNKNFGLTHTQQSSFSNDSSLTSPTSSVGESEISVNVSLSSPSVSYQPVTPPTSSGSLKSPIRHRSVITVHPEPPYTKDFVTSPTSSVNPTIGTPGLKSFTSVNLTLRQPNSNSSIPASTIDISAGPGLSGNSSGLTYSSTSYDARRGCQKNFHITVTDQGGVFSASHIRPRSCYYPGGEHEKDSPISPISGNNINPLRTATSEQCVSKQSQLNRTQQQQLQPLQEHNIVAFNNNEMCAPREEDVLTKTLERQKNRRDKLATALRDNKKKLRQVEQEINVLIDPITPGVTERLDDEIQKLRSDCESILNEIDVARRNAVVPSLPNINSEILNSSQQPQPFPRQRHYQTPLSSRPSPSPTSPRQPQLDFVQHHSNSMTTNPAIMSSTFNSPCNQAPPTYQEYCQQYLPAQNILSTDEEEYTDSQTDAEDDDDEDPWVCSMCTFRNHPQLNICECCENVRIRPGTIRILPTPNVGTNASAMPTATATATPTPTNNSNNVTSSIESDANLTQQQLQQLALHT